MKISSLLICLASALCLVAEASADSLVCNGVTLPPDPCNYSGGGCSTFNLTVVTTGPVTPASPSYHTLADNANVDCTNCCKNNGTVTCFDGKIVIKGKQSESTSSTGANFFSLGASLDSTVKGMVNISASSKITSQSSSSATWTLDTTTEQTQKTTVTAGACSKRFHHSWIRIPYGTFSQSNTYSWTISHRGSCYAWDDSFSPLNGTANVSGSSTATGPGSHQVKDSTKACKVCN